MEPIGVATTWPSFILNLSLKGQLGVVLNDDSQLGLSQGNALTIFQKTVADHFTIHEGLIGLGEVS